MTVVPAEVADAPPLRPREGDSVACSGVCLTVSALSREGFTVRISEQTMARSNLGEKREGDTLNLEPGLKLGDELGGHLLFGHADAVVAVAEIRDQGDAKLIRMGPPLLAPSEIGAEGLLAASGSVALDGVSLTVFTLEKDGGFSFTGVPHTLQTTSLGAVRLGDRLNLEFDMLAKYVNASLAGRG